MTDTLLLGSDPNNSYNFIDTELDSFTNIRVKLDVKLPLLIWKLRNIEIIHNIQ